MKNHNTHFQQTRQTHMISPNPPSEDSSALVVMTAAQQAHKLKWSGKARAELKGCKSEQVWPLWADFGSLHKWFPNLGTSRLVEGEAGKVGSVRWCVGKALEQDQDGQHEAMWAKERLVEIDGEKKLMRYELMDNNVGLKGYVSEIKVADREDGGCEVEWSFEAEAVEGWEEVGLQSYVENSLVSIVKNMEEALLSNTVLN